MGQSLTTAAFSFCALFFATTAMAETYQISPGQVASVRTGDVVIVNDGATNTVISCGGGSTPTKPVRKAFYGRMVEPFDSFAQKEGSAILREQRCNATSGDSYFKGATQAAVSNAREACFAEGFANCAQPDDLTARYQFRQVGRYEGSYACEVVALIIGRN